jgi:hypothetical protein
MSPRPDRWIRLFDLAQSMQKTDARLAKLRRPSLRRAVARMVREAERFHNESFTMMWKSRMYVNVSAIDRIKPLGDRRLGELESGYADVSQKVRHLERQSNAHGSRIRKLERWRELTEGYITACGALDRDESESKAIPNLGGVGAHAR